MITKQNIFVSLFTFIILFGEGGSCQFDAGKIKKKTCSQGVSNYAMKTVECVMWIPFVVSRRSCQGFEANQDSQLCTHPRPRAVEKHWQEINSGD